jgi:hypothetical protein
MNGHEHFASERKRLETQMLEVRSDLGAVGQRQQDLRSAHGIDSVEAQNLAGELQAQREQALRELNRINEDLRKLALAEEARAKQDREVARQVERGQALVKEALEREERDKQTRLTDAIQQKDEQLREAIGQQDRERAAVPPVAVPPVAEAPVLGVANNPGADALSAGAVAIAKTADTVLENLQLAEHLRDRQRLEEEHRKQREALEQQITNEQRQLDTQLRAQGATVAQAQAALDQQRLEHEKARADLEAQLEREREALARRQAELERQRNERADQEGLSR